MTDPTTLAVQLVAAHKGLISAHEAAAEFHAAMAEALSAERELAEPDANAVTRDYWQAQYTKNLGVAAAALQKMPAAWAAVLTIAVKE